MSQFRDIFGFGFFMCLYLTTMGVFMHGSEHFVSQVLGFFVLAWGAFALLRCLALSDSILLLKTIDQDTNIVADKDKELPWLIVNRMQIQNRVRSGFAALRFISPYMLMLMGFGAAFLMWGVVVSFYPKAIIGFGALDRNIGAFYQDFSGDVSVFVGPRGFDVMGIMTVCGKVFMIGCAFFIAQSYAFKRSYGDIACIVGALGFFAAMGLQIFANAFADPMPFFIANLWHGYGIGNFDLYQMIALAEQGVFSAQTVRVLEMGMGGQVFVMLIGVFSACVLIRTAVENKARWIFAAMGLGVLALLYCADAYFVAGLGRSDAIWFSGWVLVALLWHRAMYRGDRAYRLQQI